MVIEEFDHPGEVGQRPRKPVYFVNHHDIDEPLTDVRQQLLQSWPLHRTAGEAAVIVCGLDELPALAGLASDERLAGVAPVRAASCSSARVPLRRICGCRSRTAWQLD
jgi:hypothetical protein